MVGEVGVPGDGAMNFLCSDTDGGYVTGQPKSNHPDQRLVSGADHRPWPQELVEAIEDGVAFERLPTELQPSDVDPRLWDTIQSVNRTGWVWSRYCCEGHWDEELDTYHSDTYLQVVCRRIDLHRVARVAAATSAACLDRHSFLMTSFCTAHAAPGWVSCSCLVHGDDPDARMLAPAQQVLKDYGRRLAGVV